MTADALPSSPAADADVEVLGAMQRWLEVAVIGLHLCPFARAVHARGLIHWRVSRAGSPREVLAHLGEELLALAKALPAERDTTVLVLPAACPDFLDFNELLHDVDDLLADLGLEGELQVASFHPDYQFADAPPDDVAHCTNRAPYPALHLLRESSMSRAVDSLEDPDAIYRANIERLRSLGWTGWNALARGGFRAPQGSGDPLPQDPS